jgi:hypothetical protein
MATIRAWVPALGAEQSKTMRRMADALDDEQIFLMWCQAGARLLRQDPNSVAFSPVAGVAVAA